MSLQKQVVMASGIWYVATDLGNDFLPPNHIRKAQKQLAFTWSEQKNTFIILPQGYGDSPVLCHKMVQRDLGHLDIQNVTPSSLTYDYILIKPND